MRTIRIADTGDVLTNGEVVTATAGLGLIVKSPDGLTCARIGITNAGALNVTAVTCPAGP